MTIQEGTPDDSPAEKPVKPRKKKKPRVAEVAHEDITMNDSSAASGTTIELPHGLEIKDVEDMHRQFSAALENAPVTIDVSKLGIVDTAGVQLLLALQGEAKKQGTAVEFKGESRVLKQALAVLGLRGNIDLAGPP